MLSTTAPFLLLLLLLVSRKSSLSPSHTVRLMGVTFFHEESLISARAFNSIWFSCCYLQHSIQLLLWLFSLSLPFVICNLLISGVFHLQTFSLSLSRALSLSLPSSPWASTARTLFMFIKFRLETFFYSLSFSLSSTCIACVCSLCTFILLSTFKWTLLTLSSLLCTPFCASITENSCLCIAPPFIHLMPIDDVTTLFFSHHLFYVNFHCAVAHSIRIRSK